MEKPKRTYANAGSQKAQGWAEMHRYGEFGPDHLVTVRCVALVLSIRLQMVKQIPVTRRMIDKRGYYRKGDIDAWLKADLASPESLARRLQAEHAESVKRMMKQKSRQYLSGAVSATEAKQARAATKTNRAKPVTADELSRDPRIGEKVGLWAKPRQGSK